MICPRCNIWLPETAKFCSQCGMHRSGFRVDGAGIPAPSAAVAQPVVSPAGVARSSIPSLSPLITQASGFRPGERTIQVWRAGLEHIDSEGETTARPVMLVATDQRLIMLQESGLLNKTYKYSGHFEYRDVTSYDLTSFLKIKGLKIHFLHGGRKMRTDYRNLTEVDPVTLKGVVPAPVEQTRALLDGLMGRR